jgi:hypothetical protein
MKTIKKPEQIQLDFTNPKHMAVLRCAIEAAYVQNLIQRAKKHPTDPRNEDLVIRVEAVELALGCFVKDRNDHLAEAVMEAFPGMDLKDGVQVDLTTGIMQLVTMDYINEVRKNRPANVGMVDPEEKDFSGLFKGPASNMTN